MNKMNMFELFQTILTGFMVVLTITGVLIAYNIGKRQNEINQMALNISNFAEIFLMPQMITNQSGVVVSWKILLKNVSSYPIYLNSYVLNGVKKDVGSTAIPNNPDSWYGVPIPPSVQSMGEFSITVYFEDYMGGRYSADGFGSFENGGWNIHQSKRVVLSKN